MTKGKQNLHEILTTLEEIREKKYPHISQEVIETIVTIQFENQDQDSRTTGRDKTKQQIRKFIDQNN